MQIIFSGSIIAYHTYTVLPSDVVDASDLIARSCTAPTAGDRQGEFLVTGRGGLPTNPDEPLSRDALVNSWVTLDTSNQNPALIAAFKQRVDATEASIVEAQGWSRDRNGEIILTAQAPVVIPHGSGFTPPVCDQR